MAIRIAGTVGGDADGTVAEDPGGRNTEKRAVDAAAVSDKNGPQGRETCVERGGLRGEVSARRVHSSQSSFSASSSSSTSSSSSSKSSSSPSSSVSSSSSSSSSSARSSSIGDVLVTSRFEPQSGQLMRSPLSTSNSSTSISASHSGQVAILAPDNSRR